MAPETQDWLCHLQHMDSETGRMIASQGDRVEYLLLNLSASQLIDIICISSVDGDLLREWWTHVIIDSHSDSHSGVGGRCASFQPVIYDTVLPQCISSSINCGLKSRVQCIPQLQELM